MSQTKKLIGSIFTLVAICAIAFTLVGCGGSNNGSPAKDPKANFVGTWDIVSMEDPEQGNLGEMIDRLKSMNARLDVTFEENGNVKINIATTSDDESLNGTWEVVDDKTVKLTIEENSQDAVLNDSGQLVMEQDGVKMVCEKGGSGNNEDSNETSSSASSAKTS